MPCSPLKELEGKEDAASKKSYASLEKKSIKKYIQMKRIERSIRTQAEMSDEQRGVVRAFVTFSKASYQEKILDHYRFSRFIMFRCCQNKDLRFEGSPLLIQEACEPSDLYWENLDFAPWKRYCRVCFVILLTFMFLIICSAALVFFQSLSKSTLANMNEQLVWVVKSTPDSNTCLGFCDLDLFADRLCSGDPSSSWETVKYFDQFNDYVSDYGTWGSDCSNNWTSPCSSATLRSQHAGTCGVTDSEASMNTDWIGIEFESKQQVQCWQATSPLRSSLKKCNCSHVQAHLQRLKTGHVGMLKKTALLCISMHLPQTLRMLPGQAQTTRCRKTCHVRRKSLWRWPRLDGRVLLLEAMRGC